MSSAIKHIPFLDTSWSYQPDRSVSGGRLRHAGHVWTKGLGMHSSSRLAYETRGQYQELHAELAIDQCAADQGSVVFRVYVQDAAGNWSLAYESGVVRGGDPLVADPRGCPFGRTPGADRRFRGSRGSVGPRQLAQRPADPAG